MQSRGGATRRSGGCASISSSFRYRLVARLLSRPRSHTVILGSRLRRTSLTSRSLCNSVVVVVDRVITGAKYSRQSDCLIRCRRRVLLRRDRPLGRSRLGILAPPSVLCSRGRKLSQVVACGSARSFRRRRPRVVPPWPPSRFATSSAPYSKSVHWGAGGNLASNRQAYPKVERTTVCYSLISSIKQGDEK